MQTNSKKKLFETHPVVFPVAAGIILLFVCWGGIAPLYLGKKFQYLQQVIVDNFNWLYIAAMSSLLLFAIWLGAGRYGNIRLGADDEKPEFSTLTWFAMLFSAGMGIGLLFWGVAEPLSHFNSPPFASANDWHTAHRVMGITIFHWGLHPWALYGIVGLAIAYFGFRRGLPLSLRSVFYPLLGDGIYGFWGNLVDILAICATLFGVATSLGLGAMQVNAGLSLLLGFPQDVWVQVLLIAAITALATVSVVTGLYRGIRRLSEINITLAASLLIFVFVAGPTLFLLNAFIDNIGMYLQRLPAKSFWTGTFASKSQKAWVNGWTVFYWGWWIAWSPFVGIFIARISKGRTIREFISGVLLAPTLITIIWLTVFGDAALHQALEPKDQKQQPLYSKQKFAVQVVNEQGQPLAEDGSVVTNPKTFRGKYQVQQQKLTVAEYIKEPIVNSKHTAKTDTIATALFIMLAQYPWQWLTATLATICIILFFVTSSDSASMVIDILATGGNQDPPVVTRIFWAILEGVVAIILLIVGGLKALQTASIAAALPFIVVIIAMCFSLVYDMATQNSQNENLS